MKNSLLLVFVSIAVSYSAPVAAQTFDTPVPLTGYAWSDNVGWISFSGTGPGYSVNILPDGDGDGSSVIEGYAWNSAPGPDVNPADTVPDYNSGVGWIKFGNLGPSPVGGSSNAMIDLSTGNITGWARACAGAADPASCTGGATSTSGSWDGWISLSCDSDGTCGVSAYGPNASGGFVNDFSWGSTAATSTASSSVIGWMQWNPPTLDRVSYNPPCSGSQCVLSGGFPAEQLFNEWCEPIGSPNMCSGTCTAGACDAAPVGSLPAGTVTIDPVVVRSGGTTNITWSSPTATSCTLEQQTAGGVAYASSTNTFGNDVPSAPADRTTIFSLQCTASGDPTLEQEIASTTLRVLPAAFET